MFIQGQDFIKKELAKCFPIEDFAQIDDIFLEENENKDKDGQDEERFFESAPTPGVAFQSHMTSAPASPCECSVWMGTNAECPLMKTRVDLGLFLELQVEKGEEAA